MAKGLHEDARRMEMQLAAIRRALRRRFDAEIAKGDLTGPQQMVMAEVIKADGMSLKDLSRRVNLAHSTVSGIVDRLEKKGLLERRPSASDGRVTLLTASPAVRSFLQTNMPQLTLQPLVEALGRATPAERVAVATGLSTLSKLLEEKLL